MIGRSASGAALFAAALLALAACNPSVTPAPTPTPPEAGPANIAVACGNIELGECRFVAARIVDALPEGRKNPFSIQITLSRCELGPCPRSLGARTGQVLVEYPNGGDAILGRVEGPPAAPEITFDPEPPPYSDPITPSSARVAGPGPLEFEVGHCGLRHVVDFDGSFWVPVGEFDVESGQALNNQERGVMTLLGANVAEYRGTANFVVRLARFPGTKRFFLCD